MARDPVVAVRCASYDPAEVSAAVRRIFELSGLGSAPLPETLLLKPNMLSARPPEDGVTTHPAVLEAIRQAAPSPRLIIGDSPPNAERPIEDYWNACGYRAAAERMGASLVKFDDVSFARLPLGAESLSVPVSTLALRSPVLNLPKLKTHGLTVLTAAVKNLYGLIPGYHKSILHSKFITGDDFSRFLAAFYRAVRGSVFFSLVDAVTIMEGDGPSSGTLRHLGWLVGGKDAISVDIACCRLLGIEAREVPHLRMLSQGEPDVRTVGDTITVDRPAVLPGVRKLGVLTRVPVIRGLLRFLARFFVIEPVIAPDRCKRCMACVRVCPRDAISPEVVINRKACIRCLCCFEVCPHRAIDVKKSFLARKLT